MRLFDIKVEIAYMLTLKEIQHQKKMVALSSVGAAIGLTTIKIVVALLTGSLGILAEAAHSGLDLVASLLTYFAVRVADRPPSMEGSVTKLLWSATVQEIEHVVLDVVGPDAVTGLRPGWWSSYLRSRPASVYGGTEQIQRNIVSQRILGMPRPAR